MQVAIAGTPNILSVSAPSSRPAIAALSNRLTPSTASSRPATATLSNRLTPSAASSKPAIAAVPNRLAAFTLEQLIHSGSSPSIYRLSQDLFHSLEWINAENCWFTDICEKQILCSRDGRFSISTLGNTASQAELPDTAIYACKDYWMPVFSYLIGRLRLTELNPGEFPGILFNYLQTMLLILRVRLVFIDQEGYYNSASLFDQLPMILDKLIPEYRALFIRMLAKDDCTSLQADLQQIKNLFIERVVLPPANTDPTPAAPTSPAPLSSGSLRSGPSLRNGDILIAIIFAIALTFSAWLWASH